MHSWERDDPQWKHMPDDLRRAGFYIVALDLRAGRCTPEWALDHVRRTIPKRNAHGRALARAVLKRWVA